MHLTLTKWFHEQSLQLKRALSCSGCSKGLLDAGSESTYIGISGLVDKTNASLLLPYVQSKPVRQFRYSPVEKYHMTYRNLRIRLCGLSIAALVEPYFCTTWWLSNYVFIFIDILPSNTTQYTNTVI